MGSVDRTGSGANDGLAAVVIAAFAIACCAALPLLATLAGSVALATILGIGAGVVAMAVLVALIVSRQRARRQPSALDVEADSGGSRGPRGLTAPRESRETR